MSEVSFKVPYKNKYVLGIVGSPRRGGNTETLVDIILKSAVEQGATSEKVILNELEIAPCQACDGCQRTGSCIHDDDMKQLLPLMEKSDVWVLGTPIYWWGPTAQFKAFIDRWYGVDQKKFQGKEVILAIPMGGRNGHYARHIIGMIEDICNYLSMTLVDTVLAPGMIDQSSARESPHVMASARAAGMRIMNAY